MDPSATLGIERRSFDVDLAAVEKTHRELSRALHPDRYAGAAAERAPRRAGQGRRGQRGLARRAGSDPPRRGALAARAASRSARTSEPKADPAFLMEMLEQREALAEAKQRARSRGACGAWPRAIDARSRDVGAASCADAASREAEATASRLVGKLGELRFYRRFLDEVSAIEDELAAIDDPLRDLRPQGPAAPDRHRPRHDELARRVREQRAARRHRRLRPGGARPERRRVPARAATSSSAGAPQRSPRSTRATRSSASSASWAGAPTIPRRAASARTSSSRPTPGEPNIVRFRVAGERVVTPVEVSAEILRALKAQAEDELRNVGGAVITVPAYFDDAQRQATKDAGAPRRASRCCACSTSRPRRRSPTASRRSRTARSRSTTSAAARSTSRSSCSTTASSR